MALGVEGVRVGCWTRGELAPGGEPPPGSSPASESSTGCTVILPPPESLGAVAVRGAAPGTREAIALGPGGKLTVCHAVVLAGGSAFGLAAADGVVDWLEEKGVGYPVGGEENPLARVPIVGAAIVLDRSVMTRGARPDAAAGRAACDAATSDDPEEGSVGVGAGCTVAKVAGIEHCWRGGQGIAVRSLGGVTVGALVANNAVGEIRAEDGTWIARSRAPREQPRFPLVLPGRDPEVGDGGGPHAGSNTVIGCLVTNARLTKAEAVRVADLGHTGIARAVRPAHTSFDGDALFCLATGQVDTHVDLVAVLAAEAVAEACRRGVQHARSSADVPGLADTVAGE